MRIAVGSDHAGYRLKRAMGRELARLGHDVLDLGCGSDRTRVDYPDYAVRVARAVATGRCARGVLACGTGIGMAMAANKVRGIRAAVCWDVLSARLAGEHNAANVLCVGGRMVTAVRGAAMLRAWLNALPKGGRHARRVRKIMALEKAGGLKAAPTRDKPRIGTRERVRSTRRVHVRG